MEDKRYPKIGDFLNWNKQSWFVFNIMLHDRIFNNEKVADCVEIINQQGIIKKAEYHNLAIRFMTMEERKEFFKKEPFAKFDGDPFELTVFLTHENELIRELVKLFYK